MAALTEEDVTAAVLGDPAAMRSVYETLAPPIVGYLRSRGSEDPEGLAQDVFVALIPQIRKLQGGMGGLRTLAFSIAHARLVDETRRRAGRPTAVAFDPDDDSRVTPSAEDHAMAQVGDDAVVELLSTLNPDQRSVIALRVVAQLSLEETAQVIGRSVGSVKQLQRRGLLALRARVLAAEDVTQ
jgi:RNA polymerase sigma-70 factor (ECF subfamily)